MTGLTQEQPQWFRQYLEQRPADKYVSVKNARIHYRHWHNSEAADASRPGLVFVHGHAAHARWWDFIAPAFATHQNVIALDVSGAGDSDHRDTYSASLFAEEIVAVAHDAGLSAPMVVGHSFGGAMTRVAAWQHREAFAGIILIDSAIPEHKGTRQAPPMPRQKERFYPSLEQGMRRFRLRPPQPCAQQFILDYIAEHSLRSTDKGFQFKYDSAVFAKMKHDEEFPAAAEMIKELRIPVGLIYGEQSRFFPPESVEALSQLLKPSAIRCIPEAHHHVFLDQPLPFIETLQDLLQSFS